MTSNSSTTLDTRASGTASSRSRSQTLMPVMEDRPGGTWSVEDQVFVLADDIASLPRQYGVVSIGGRVNMKFRALDAPDERIGSSAFAAFLEQLRQENPYLVPVGEARPAPNLPKAQRPEDPDFFG